MPYDEGLAQRIRDQLQDRKDVEEKKMFGGLCFMVSGHMCCGIVENKLMARVGPDQYDSCLKRKHAKEMDFTGQPLKGLVYVRPDGLASDTGLKDWIALCIRFVESLPPKNTV